MNLFIFWHYSCFLNAGSNAIARSTRYQEKGVPVIFNAIDSTALLFIIWLSEFFDFLLKSKSFHIVLIMLLLILIDGVFSHAFGAIPCLLF